ncbi:Histidinol-phosphate aminotransferase [Geodia barretti]|uniref:Histidinol-phosphate aminotransferase n=1 Tax=Geodia barretti TaxID=519541 RepID=A0AA35U0H5_GEOBA|nr:Histidinol-phosphate aminotransferase [Geodia barretti]
MEPNVVMTRTFSKVYGLAELSSAGPTRRPPLSTCCTAFAAPFNATPNAAALAAALAALEDQDHIVRSCRHNEACRDALAARLDAAGLPGPLPSVCNFLLVRFGRAMAGRCGGRSLSQRTRGSGPSDGAYHLADCLRITVGLEAENEAVAQVLEPSWRRLRQRQAANGERARALLAPSRCRPRPGQLLARAGLA